MEGIIFLIIIIVSILAYRSYKKGKFAKEMGIPKYVLRSCSVGGCSEQPVGTFHLDYPEWVSANRDGTRDKRTNDMSRIKAVSELCIGKWKVRSKSPIRLYGVVTALRFAGHSIDLIPQEQAKLTGASVVYQARKAGTVMDLVRAFYRKDKKLFREFCSSVCAKNGYAVFVDDNPPQGYDFGAGYNGVYGLVACSCENVGSNVGLPALRSLANAAVAEGKSEMMYITTGGYSAQAKSFAMGQNIHLIDGNQLLGMVQAAWGSDPDAGTIPFTEYMLEEPELCAGFPRDMQPY